MAFAEGSATPSPGPSAGFQPQGPENNPVRAAIPGEAKTLPQGVYRLRAIYSAARSESGFSDNGKREDGGWRAALDAGAFVVEYGLRPGISLQLVAPVVVRSQRGLDVQKFRNSSLYAQLYEDKLKQVIDKLVSSKLCADAETCRVAIEEKSLSFPFTTVVLDTGETLELKTAVPIKSVLSSLVSNAAVPESGRTGRGDLELGALVSVADPEVGLVRHWDVNVSLGLGLRVPTGFFEDVPSSQRPTGRGSWDLGLRANVDKVFSENLVVSWQNQSELTLRDGKKKRTSLLDNTRLNTADPNVEGGDGKPNTGGFRRTTTRQVGFVKLAWGGEVLHQSLDTFVLNSAFKYDFDSPGEVEGQSLGSESSLMSAQLGITWDGLRVSLPVQLDLDYTLPLAGKNIPSAPGLFTSTLKVYLKI
jgi:hypothetical protein